MCEDGFAPINQDQLLMNRETHLCVYDGFEPHFQKLFDQQASILFQNWTVHSSYGNEMQNVSCMDAFINEILSSKEIDKIKSMDEEDPEIRRRLTKFRNRLLSFNAPQRKTTEISSESQDNTDLAKFKEFIKSQKGTNHQRLNRYGSFMIPKDSIDKQILQTAIDIASQSIILSKGSNHNQSDYSFSEEEKT